MLFYTPEFLVFSLLLLGILGLVHRSEGRKLVLLVASYVFYMWWNPAFILLIMFSTGVDYVVGGRMAREPRPAARRWLLVSSLVANLGMLGFFKYSGFLSSNLLALSQSLGLEIHWTTIEVLLPVGISFYTFQTLSYTIDVYRGAIPATRHPLDFALFVAFFPQLVAGPIVRAAGFLPQLRQPVRLYWDRATLFLIAGGLVKKVVVADNIGVFADSVFADPSAWPSAIIWLATIGFAIQIYCDFSGYTDIAIGVARVLGFQLPKNFDYPYFARNPSDFWRRWHISLSSWLRDYLYISLGGNRYGSFRTYRNLMLTMLLGGLWHGASWNFVLWGFMHGLALVVHRLYQSVRRRADPAWRPSERALVRVLCIAAMQYWVLLTWIAFRVSDFDQMWIAMQKFVLFDAVFDIRNLGLGAMSTFSTLALMSSFAALHLAARRVGGLHLALARAPVPVGAAVCVALGAVGYFLWPLDQAPFIYFQF